MRYKEKVSKFCCPCLEAVILTLGVCRMVSTPATFAAILPVSVSALWLRRSVSDHIGQVHIMISLAFLEFMKGLGVN